VSGWDRRLVVLMCWCSFFNLFEIALGANAPSRRGRPMAMNRM
jgi:hypothetical protein